MLLWLQRRASGDHATAATAHLFLRNARFPHHSCFSRWSWPARGNHYWTDPLVNVRTP
jgi:hypothetical protein